MLSAARVVAQLSAATQVPFGLLYAPTSIAWGPWRVGGALQGRVMPYEIGRRTARSAVPEVSAGVPKVSAGARTTRCTTRLDGFELVSSFAQWIASRRVSISRVEGQL